MKKYIKYLFLLAILVAIFGFYEYNRPHKNVSHMSTDFKTEASQLFTEFEEDETAANAKYLDKVIEVSGIISNITAEQEEAQSITIETENMMFGIIGELDPLSTHKTNDLKKGDRVTLKGICSGMLSDVILVRCVIL